MKRETHNNLNNKSKGFTLVEVLIYIVLISGVLISFVTFLISISNSRNKVYAKQEVQANARMALNLISQTIRLANGINVASSTFAIDPGTLSLSMDEIGENPTIINLNEDDGFLQIKKGDGVAIAITSDEVKITNLVFTNLTSEDTNENVKIEITAEYRRNDNVFFEYSTNLQTTINLKR